MSHPILGKDGPTPWPTQSRQDSLRDEPTSPPDVGERTRHRLRIGDDEAPFVSFLERHWPRGPSEAAGAAGNVEAPSNLESGSLPERIDRFRILRELGNGGFATVYLAHDPLADRVVALKVPHPEVARSEALCRRFEREVRATTSLDHPHINPIYETGKSASAMYIASHYCNGPTLAEWLKRRLAPVAPQSAARLVADLADAVQHAHDRGVLHRDLKPSNVLLEVVDPRMAAPSQSAPLESFTARLADFGLARVREDVPDDERTRTGMLLGTPRYMSPEQAVGDHSAVTARSDVYSLGVILYELLSGRPPFLGDTELETLRQIKFDEAVSVRRLQPRVPRDLDTICAKCLEKAPQRRYASARELAQDLRRYIDREAIHARPKSLARRARTWTVAHPIQAAALLGGLAVIIGLPAALTWHTLRLERAFRVADQERAKAQEFESQARASERQAVINAHNVEQLVYASDMRLASLLLKEGDFQAVASLVDRHDPAHGAGADRRGFEWWYYRPFGAMARHTWQAHQGELNLLAFSADGKVMLTASNDDRLAKAWDVSTRSLRAQLPLRNSSELGGDRAGALTPDGALAATVVARDTVAVWDTATGKVEAQIKHADRVRSVAFSPDGQRLITGGDDASRIWRRGKWDTIERELVPSRIARYSPDGRTLAVVWAPAFSSHVLLLNVETLQKERELAFWHPVLEFAYSPDGRVVAAVCDSPEGTVIAVNNPETGAVITHAHWRRVRTAGVSLSANGSLLASVTQEGGLRFWNTSLGQASGGLRSAGGKISEFSFSPDDSWLATSAGGSISLWSQSLIGGPRPLAVTAACASPVVYHPLKSQVAVAQTDGSLALVDAAKLEITARLQAHLDRIVDIAYSGDGQHLASVDGRSLCVWSAADDRLVWQSAVPGAKCVGWSPDGATLVTGGTDKILRLWDVATKTERGQLTAHAGDVRGARFTADGKHLLSYDSTGDLRVWDAASGKEAAPGVVAAVPLIGLAVRRDEPIAAVQAFSGDATLYKLGPEGSLEQFGPALKWPKGNLPWFLNEPGSLTFAPDGKRLGHAGPGDTFAAEDVATATALYQIGGRGLDPTSGAYSADGQTLATVGRGQELTFWDTSSWHCRHVFGAPLAAVRSLAFSGDSQTLFVASDHAPDSPETGFAGFPRAPNVRLPRANAVGAAGEPLAGGRSTDFVPWQSTADSLRTWDVESGREQRRLEVADTLTMLPALAASSARNLLAGAARDGTLWVWDSAQGTLLARRSLNEDVSRAIDAARSADTLVPQAAIARLGARPCVAFAVDGSRMFTLDGTGILQIWDTQSWEPLGAATAKVESPQAILMSPDGSQLVALSGAEALLFDAHSARLLRKFGAPGRPRLLCGAYSPDGRTLALGTVAGQVERYDVESGKRATPLVGHLDAVGSLAYSPDGRTLATGSWDATVRLWDVASSREVAALEGHRGRVHTVAFSPNGNLLASGGEIENGQGEVFLWRGDRRAEVRPLDGPRAAAGAD